MFLCSDILFHDWYWILFFYEYSVCTTQNLCFFAISLSTLFGKGIREGHQVFNHVEGYFDIDFHAYYSF